MITPKSLRSPLFPTAAVLCFVTAAQPRAATAQAGADTSDRPTWCALGDPVVRIGAADGGPGQALSGVVGAHRFADGRLVVANAGSYELRFFDPDGRYLTSAGRQGDGPGEFRRITLLRSFARDSLLTFDARQLRASVFGPDGRLARSFPMPAADGFVMVEDVFPDGRSIARVGQGFQSDRTSTGRHRRDVGLLALDREGAVLTDLGRFPGEESYALSSDGSMIVGPLVFGAALYVAAPPGRVVVGISDEDGLRVLDDSGARATIDLAALGLERLPATADDFRLAVERYLEGFPPDAREIERRRFDDMPRVDRLPAFAGLRADADARVWVRHARHPGDPRRTWTVIDARGAPVADARLPDGSDLLEIGHDSVIVLVVDELGIERVEVRPLARGNAGGCP